MKRTQPPLALPQLRRITPGLFAVRIPRRLLSRIKKLPGLQQSSAGKDVFYFETEAPDGRLVLETSAGERLFSFGELEPAA